MGSRACLIISPSSVLLCAQPRSRHHDGISLRVVRLGAVLARRLLLVAVITFPFCSAVSTWRSGPQGHASSGCIAAKHGVQVGCLWVAIKSCLEGRLCRDLAFGAFLVSSHRQATTGRHLR